MKRAYFFLYLVICMAMAYAEDEVLSLLNQADSAFHESRFEEAENIYELLLENYQFKSSKVLYNLGNCYLQQDKWVLAKWAFLSASQQAPLNSRIQNNLLVVEKKLQLNRKSLNPGFLETFFFWNRFLPEMGWFLWFFIASFLFVIVLFIYFKRKINLWILLVSVFLLLLPLTSFAVRFYQQKHPECVLVEASVLRTGNGDFYEHLEIPAMEKGETLRIIQGRSSWFEVETGDNYRGWIEQYKLKKLVY